MTRAILLLLLPAASAFGQEKPAVLPGKTSLPEQQAAAEKPVAVSKDGLYRLKLRRSSQTPSTRNATIARVSLDFDLEFTEPGTRTFRRQKPQDVYLDNLNPFVSARIAPGREVGERHSGWTDNFGPSVTLSDLELDSPQEKLEALRLAATLVRVKTWDTIQFADLKRGESDHLRCGPFALRVTGKDKEASVVAASFAEFEADRKEFEKRVPLRFLHHAYAIDHTVIHDAKKRRLYSTSSFGSGGATVGTFAIIATGSGIVLREGEPIEYPLLVEVRLPKEYDTERVEFEFKDLSLPELKKTP
jgi:hypothetical protein